MISNVDLEAFGYYDSYWREELEEKEHLSVSQMVEEYQKVAGQEPDPALYADLVEEEFGEWETEYWCSQGILMDENRAPCTYEPKEELKELSDLVYVIYGYAKARGWNLEEAVRRVHKNNMQRMFQGCDECNGSGDWYFDDSLSWEPCPKCKGRGSLIKRREDGKILKNPNVEKVRLDDLV